MPGAIKDFNTKSKSSLNGIYLSLSLIGDHYFGAVGHLTDLIHLGLECTEETLYHYCLLDLRQKECNRDTRLGFPILDDDCV